MTKRIAFLLTEQEAVSLLDALDDWMGTVEKDIMRRHWSEAFESEEAQKKSQKYFLEVEALSDRLSGGFRKGEKRL